MRIHAHANIDHEILINRTRCRATLGEDIFIALKTAIQRRVNNTYVKKRSNMDSKFDKITRCNKAPENEGWLKNLSDRQLTTAEQEVLIKGMKFNTKDASHREYLADFEHALRSNGTSSEEQQQIRQIVIPNLSRHKPFNALSKQESTALRSLKNDSDIIILPADKGRVTVVLNKTDYIEKAMALLRDSNTYSVMANDQTSKLSAKINNTLKKLQELERANKRRTLENEIYGLNHCKILWTTEDPQTRYPPETNRILTEFTNLQTRQRAV